MCVLSSLLGMESGRVECLVRLSAKPESYPSWQMHRFHDRHLRNTNKPRAESVSPQPAKGFEDFQVWAGPWGWRCLSWVTRARWRWLCPSPPPCPHAGRCVHGAAFCLSFLPRCAWSCVLLVFPPLRSPVFSSVLPRNSILTFVNLWLICDSFSLGMPYSFSNSDSLLQVPRTSF